MEGGRNCSGVFTFREAEAAAHLAHPASGAAKEERSMLCVWRGVTGEWLGRQESTGKGLLSELVFLFVCMFLVLFLWF